MSGRLGSFSLPNLSLFIVKVLAGEYLGIYSIKNGPMERSAATAHIPVLLLFYFVQYAILKQHIPLWAPWIAFASMGLLLIVYVVVRSVMRVATPAGHFIVTAYAAVVLLHAGYLELLAGGLQPWIAIAFVMAMGAYAIFREERVRESWPLFAAAGLIFLHNYLRLVFGWSVKDIHAIPGYQVLIVLYAVVLYVGYWMTYDRRDLATLSKTLYVYGAYQPNGRRCAVISQSSCSLRGMGRSGGAVADRGDSI
jgi:hypothetical protein